MGDIISQSSVFNTCPQHKIEYLGLCSKQYCFENGLLCKICNKDSPCILENHPIISLEDFKKKYFKYLPRLVNFKSLAALLKLGESIKQKEMELQQKNYEEWERKIVNEKLDAFKKRLNDKFNNFKNNLLKKLEEINKDFHDANKDLENTINSDIPDFKLEDTLKFLDENKGNKVEIENFMGIIKKFMDNDKLKKNQNNLQNILYGKTLFENLQTFEQEQKTNDLKIILSEKIKDFSHKLFPPMKFYEVYGDFQEHFCSDPSHLVFKETITSQSQKKYTIDSVFSGFKAKDLKTYVVCSSNYNDDILIFDLENIKENKVLKGHTGHIFIVRHFYKRENTTDYLISADTSKSIIVWNFNNMTKDITIKNAHKGSYIYSVLMIFDNKKDYIVSSSPNEYMKVWDLSNGQFIREIGRSDDYTYYINKWYHDEKFYIVNANSSNVKIYEMDRPNHVFKEYSEGTNSWHMSAFIEKYNDVDILVESDGSGTVRLWDVLKGTIFKKICCNSTNFRGLCFWNEDFIIACASDKTFKVIDVKKQAAVYSLVAHGNSLCTAIKVKHPRYGESLITASIDGTINLFTNKIHVDGKNPFKL